MTLADSEVDPVVQTTVYDQRLAARETYTKGLARLLIDQQGGNCQKAIPVLRAILK
jgi:hypothetical protein